MGFPEGAQTTVLTMKIGLADGRADREPVTITPMPQQIVSTALNHIVEGDPLNLTPDRGSGSASVRLLNTDAAGYLPTGWTYKVERGSRPAYYIQFPASLGATADLADLTPVSADPGTYDVLLPASELGTAAFLDVGQVEGTVAAGDDDRFSGGGGGGPSPSGTVAASTGFGQSSAAGTATTYSRGDHAHGTPATPTKSTVGLGSVDNTSDASKPVSTATGTAIGTVSTALTTHTAASTSVHGIADTSALVLTGDTRLTNSRSPSGAAGGDLGGSYPNPSVAKVAGVAVSGTAASGKVLTASSSSAASWQDPTGGGGGSKGFGPIVQVRVTDHNLTDLPDAPSWTVVQTSGGTLLQGTIPAVVGDRIRVCPDFMRKGSHFLDWVVLVDGAIIYYRTTKSSTPPPEGRPSLYPSLSFSYTTSSVLFTVTEDMIDGDGNVTIGLAHQGTGSFLIYAHTTYPFEMDLENGLQ